MGDERIRTGLPRDVPPPRPVPPPPAGRSAAGADVDPLAGVGRAARALADAVAGLLDARPGETTGPADRSATRRAAGGLRDVVTAVAGALAGARSGAPGTGPTAAAPAAGGRTPGSLLGDLLATAAPRLPVRDRDRLRGAHPGATDDEIAGALVARAATLTTAVGAATGGLAAVHWFAPPSLLAVPLELGAETVVVAAVELVLVGELHELYGRRPAGDAGERAAAYLESWSARRAAGAPGSGGLGAVLGTAGAQAMRRALTRRLVRAVPSAAPFMVGAALAGRGNRKATEALAERLIADLRGPRSPLSGRPAPPPR